MSGVAFIVESLAQEVLELAKQIAAMERAMSEAIERRDAVSQVMAREYERMLESGSDG